MYKIYTLQMAFIRRIKKASGTYFAKVESYREDGKVKQKVVEYLGKDLVRKAKLKDDGGSKTGVAPDTVHNVLQSIHNAACELGLPDFFGNKGYPLLAVTYKHLHDGNNLFSFPEWIERNNPGKLFGIKDFNKLESGFSLDFINKFDFEILVNGLRKFFNRHDKSPGVIFSDITDYCFDIRNPASKINLKSHVKNSRQVKTAIGVTVKQGFPLYLKVYEEKPGVQNLYTYLSENLKAGYNGILMHKGKSRNKSIKQLNESGMKGIIGLKFTADMRKEFAGRINTDETRQGRHHFEHENNSLFFFSFEYLNGKLLVVYNLKQELLARNMGLFFSKAEKFSEYSGYTFIYHNSGLDDRLVLKKYFDDDPAKTCFRNTQDFLTCHAPGQWGMKHFEAYMKICFLSLCISAWMKYKNKNGFFKK